ncbi:alpha-L-fucosidase [Prolixibacteraceae bacterium JC049]|nr:alpha-L-fucosidase [Prolixibacteraceae bacterium JC049]
MIRSMMRSLLGLLLISVVSCAPKEQLHEKKVSFTSEMNLEQKVAEAARVVPTKQQLDWQKLEMTAFIHFTVNTFTDMEWGHGDESPQIFNPTQLDTRQWVKNLKDAGMKLVILTCKHHDGFCLWPTKTTDHSVVSSPWKDGKGDVVKELRAACDEFGMKFGVYLSPWDRNASCYGDSPKYNEFFVKQLTELLTWYGKVDEVWFDGACGEGPNGKKQEYDWDSYYSTIKELQPEAVVAVVGEDVRWVGTESGYGRETEWSVTALAPGGRPANKAQNAKLKIGSTSHDLGSREMIDKVDNLYWFPAEVDVSIRPGWFYHKSQDNQVKSLAKMVDIYFNSVGRNAVLLLNIPPDQRGLIHENDVKRLKEFRAYLDRMYQTNFIAGVNTEASNAVDGNWDSAFEFTQFPSSVEFDLNGEKDVNVLMIQELISKGQRVEAFKLEAMIDGKWNTVVKSTTIGYKKLKRFQSVKTSKVRLTIEKARGPVYINEIGLYKAPELLTEARVIRNKQGWVSMSTETPHPVITYTLDGSEPTAKSTVYKKPIQLPKGGTVKARAFVNNFSEKSAVTTEIFDVCPAKWSVVKFSDEHSGHRATNAIDGNANTMWHTPWGAGVKKHPHFVSVDLGETLGIKGFTYTPRTSSNKSGTIFRYNFYVSKDGKSWKKVKSRAEFSNMKNNPIKQYVRFGKTYKARYFKFESVEGIANEAWLSLGELGIITR